MVFEPGIDCVGAGSVRWPLYHPPSSRPDFVSHESAVCSYGAAPILYVYSVRFEVLTAASTYHISCYDFWERAAMSEATFNKFYSSPIGGIAVRTQFKNIDERTNY